MSQPTEYQWPSHLGQGYTIRAGSVEQQKAYETTPRTAPSRTGCRTLSCRTLLDMDPSSPTGSEFADRTAHYTSSSSQWLSAGSSSSPEHADSVITPESDDNSDHTVDPKIEELDDHGIGDLDSIEETKLLPRNSVALPPARKRGRPRKHPLTETRKTTHTRSKTGCATCRRRKKRCDERKPSCLACEKNNVVCEGYEPKQQWRGGKEKAVTVRPTPISPELPLLVPGIEGAVDQLFFQHFTCHVSKVLSVNDYQNPFLEHIVPMSMSHPGLMHSLLSLSGSCLVAKAQDTNSEWEQRQIHHSGKAMVLLSEDLRNSYNHRPEQDAIVSDPSIAQTLILCLETVCSGDRTGLYRVHLNALKTMLTQRQRRFPNEQLRQFILEFLIYHDYSASITAADYSLDQRSLDLMASFNLPTYMIDSEPTRGSTLLGVLDGLFGIISRIRALRDKSEPAAPSAWQTAWTCAHPPNTPRYAASLLYRQCAWIYLHRTIMQSQPSAAFKQAVDEGLTYLRMLPDTPDGSTQSILLMPLFLLGCAAFEPAQRPEIRAAFKGLKEWSGLGNISYAGEIVEQIWVMMDEGREEETWDWEGIIKSRGWDFLIT
ncbi:hypothetical protein Q7P37_006388 [Cladosporium fusiforme]